jgi:hypothetical protein
MNIAIIPARGGNKRIPHKNIKQFGFAIYVQRYYSRRGDFGSAKYQRKMPDKFYEYLFCVNFLKLIY